MGKKRDMFLETMLDKIDEEIDKGNDLWALRDFITYYQDYQSNLSEDLFLDVLTFVVKHCNVLYIQKLVERYKEVRYD